MSEDRKLRAVIAVPLKEEHCALIEELEPRLEVVRDHSLYYPMRIAADWAGDQSVKRSPEKQVEYEEMIDSADLLFGIPDLDIASLKRTVDTNPNLRWVMTTLAGGGAQVKAADLSREQLERVTVTTAAGITGAPLAEFALFGVLAGAKNLPKLQRDQKNHKWGGRWVMKQLYDMTVLVVGLGGIGSECVTRFKAMGSKVWGASRSGRSVEGLDRALTPDQLGDVMGEVDAIVITAPGTDSTHHMISRDLLNKAKDGVIIANVGRGTVIDEDAMIDSLRSGKIGFAALDVFTVEPLPEDSPLWDLENVLICPHTSALNAGEEELMARRFAENATNFIEGRPMSYTMDTTEFY